MVGLILRYRFIERAFRLLAHVFSSRHGKGNDKDAVQGMLLAVRDRIIRHVLDYLGNDPVDHYRRLA